MKRIIILTAVMAAASFAMTARAQRSGKFVQSGNKKYNQQQYVEAENDYRRGLERNDKSFESAFNLADALFRQQKYDDAVKQYEQAGLLIKGDDKMKRAAVMHNIGNAYYAQQQYDKSVEAYKEALRNNPKDDDTRYNLAAARRMMQQNQDQQQQQEQQQNQQDQQQQQQDQQQQQQEQNQAEQTLRALEQAEKDAQEKARKAQVQAESSDEKDW